MTYKSYQTVPLEYGRCMNRKDGEVRQVYVQVRASASPPPSSVAICTHHVVAIFSQEEEARSVPDASRMCESALQISCTAASKALTSKHVQLLLCELVHREKVMRTVSQNQFMIFAC